MERRNHSILGHRWPIQRSSVGTETRTGKRSHTSEDVGSQHSKQGKQQVQGPTQEQLSKFREQDEGRNVEPDWEWRVQREMPSERRGPAGHGEKLAFYSKSNENTLETP